MVFELDKEGLECRCGCPSCGLGLCVCASHGTLTLNQAWRETAPAATPGGVSVRPAVANSAAARAGLREGDVIIAVDDKEVRSIADQQAAIRKHESGDEITLRVRRGPSDPLEIKVTRP